MLMKHLMHQYKFIEKANLPENPVAAVAISCMAGESIKKLNSSGIKTYIINNNPLLPDPVDSHADLQILHLGKDVIFCQSEHLCIGESTQKFKKLIINESAGNNYPDDVRLNCAIIGKNIICNEKTISKDILDYGYQNGFGIINVNQGYTKCSICIVNENAIITDDESIFAAAGNFLNDVLFISKGSIRLKGYNYGFIGGCCGKISENKIAFNGEISAHKDCNKIIDFLNKYNVECIELKKGLLDDIGGIIPLYEYI